MQDNAGSRAGQSSTSGANPAGFPQPGDLTGEGLGRGSAGRSSGGAGSSADRSRSSGAPGSTTPTVNQAKQALSTVATQAGEKVASRLDTQKDKAADELGNVAHALRQTGDQLRGQNQDGGVHQYVASAADQIERLSGYLRSTNTRELMSGVERFAREQPALFVGGAFMLGLLGARFLKSSGQTGSATASMRQTGIGGADEYEATRTYGRGYAGTTPGAEYRTATGEDASGSRYDSGAGIAGMHSAGDV